jgi:hypothetical protein
MPKTIWSRFVAQPFLDTLREVPWFGPVVSGVLVALLVNTLSNALVVWGGVALGWAGVALTAAAIVAFAHAHTAVEARRRARGLGPLVDLPNPPQKQGLIFLFSRIDQLQETVRHHSPVLQHCWLVVTHDKRASAMQAMDRLRQHFPNTRFYMRELTHLYDSQRCREIVRRIYQVEAPDLGISQEQVIADITGGTKPMTLGMVAACLDGNYPMEHVPTRFDADGRPDGPLKPIQIVVEPTGVIRDGAASR